MVRMLGGDENVSQSLYAFMTLNVCVTTLISLFCLFGHSCRYLCNGRILSVLVL